MADKEPRTVIVPDRLPFGEPLTDGEWLELLDVLMDTVDEGEPESDFDPLIVAVGLAVIPVLLEVLAVIESVGLIVAHGDTVKTDADGTGDAVFKELADTDADADTDPEGDTVAAEAE